MSFLILQNIFLKIFIHNYYSIIHIFFVRSLKFSTDIGEGFSEKKIGKIIRYYVFGGDCVQYGLLAEGKIPMVAECDLKPFDLLILVNLIEETGGTITEWKGYQLSLKSGSNIIASLSKKNTQ
jgi:fructose-1,6-bisphosphatase/inositol monophosphatase family enzyme